MENHQQFGKTATKLARNPLGIIALFIVLIYGVAALVLGLTSGNLDPSEKLPLIWFLVVFPVLVLIAFIWLVTRHPRILYGPQDFEDASSFLQYFGAEMIKDSIETELKGRFNDEKQYTAEEAETIAKEVVDKTFTYWDVMRRKGVSRRQLNILRFYAQQDVWDFAAHVNDLDERFDMIDVQELIKLGWLKIDDNMWISIAHPLIFESIKKSLHR